MNIKLDKNISPRLKHRLGALGHDVLTVHDEGLLSMRTRRLPRPRALSSACSLRSTSALPICASILLEPTQESSSSGSRILGLKPRCVLSSALSKLTICMSLRDAWSSLVREESASRDRHPGPPMDRKQRLTRDACTRVYPSRSKNGPFANLARRLPGALSQAR